MICNIKQPMSEVLIILQNIILRIFDLFSSEECPIEKRYKEKNILELQTILLVFYHIIEFACFSTLSSTVC